MDDPIDLLQIKIENAKRQLSEDALNAIAAVPWQAEIIKMRETKGYSFEQLGNLEMETELVLCGLLSPGDYPREIENRMKINKAQANELVNEMNELVFAKIKEEMIKNVERFIHPGASATPQEGNNTTQIFKEHGIEIIEKNDLHPMLTQKLSGSFQIPIVKTEHTLENITKTAPPAPIDTKAKIPKVDPYREIPE